MKKIMSMDLISGEEAIKYLALDTDCGTHENIANALMNDPAKVDEWLSGIDEAIALVKKVPSVKVFPIKELCKTLAENCDCPTGYSPDCDRNCAKCWEHAITKWVNEDEISS